MTNEINLMTAVEAAKYLNIPVKTLQTWRCTKRVKVPYLKIGGNVRYRKSDLDAYINGLVITGE